MPETVPIVVGLSHGRQAELTPSTTKERVHLRITPNPQAIAGAPDAVVYVDGAWNPTSPRARAALETAAGLVVGEAGIIFTAFEQACQAQYVQEVQAQQIEQQAKGPRFDVTQRLMTQAPSQGLFLSKLPLDDLLRLLARPGMPDDSVVEWKRQECEQLCVLDVDFHHQDPDPAMHPTQDEICELGEDLRPTPSLWWRSHGNGLKAVFQALPPFTAVELAAGAAAQVLCTPFVVRCKGTVEILTRTRHPTSRRGTATCGAIHQPGPTDQFACLHRFSHADASMTEIEEILDLLQVEIGDRLPHDQCVIDPGHISKSAEPVMVNENGIFCFSCQGSGDPGKGFRSWGAIRKMNGLVLSQMDSGGAAIMKAAQHFVHADHACYLFKSIAPEIKADYRRPLYSALLKHVHGDDARIPMAFTPFGFVRGRSCWLHAKTLRLAKSLTEKAVSVLPSTHVPNPAAEPETATVPYTPYVTMHVNDGPIDGWKPIDANAFVPIHGVHNDPPSAEYTVTCSPDIIVDGKPHVAYLRPEARIPRAEAEQRISAYFPGVSIRYLTAIMVAMGSAESGEGMVPMLWASGPTGAAKTTTTRIVLEMFGEEFKSLSGVEKDQLNLMFGEAISNSRLVLFDDFAKEPKEYRRWHTFFLQVNRTHTFRKLYVGEVTLPIRSALILPDRELPEYFKSSPQFGRRVHHIHLDLLPQSWEEIGHKVERWWQKTPELTQAAESFYSWVVDEFFPEGDQESFSEKMKRLDIHLLGAERHDEVETEQAIGELVTQLVMGICNGITLPGNDEKRLGQGFREAVQGTQGAISIPLTKLVDALGPVPWDKEHLETALDKFQQTLHKRFGLVDQARLEVKHEGRRLYIRLAQLQTSRYNRNRLFNRELFPAWPPDPSTFQHTGLGGVIGRPHVNGHNGVNGVNGHHSLNEHTITVPTAPSVAEVLAGPARPARPMQMPELTDAMRKLMGFFNQGGQS